MKHKIHLKIARKEFDKQRTGEYYWCFGEQLPNYTYSYYDIQVFITHLLDASEKSKLNFNFDIISVKEIDEIRHYYNIIIKSSIRKETANIFIITLFSVDKVIAQGFALLKLK